MPAPTHHRSWRPLTLPRSPLSQVTPIQLFAAAHDDIPSPEQHQEYGEDQQHERRPISSPSRSRSRHSHAIASLRDAARKRVEDSPGKEDGGKGEGKGRERSKVDADADNDVEDDGKGDKEKDDTGEDKVIYTLPPTVIHDDLLFRKVGR